MNNALRVLCIIFLIVLTDCGYRVAGYHDDSSKVRLYLASLGNTSDDLTIGRKLEQNVSRFLQNYGVASDQESANCNLSITLTQKLVSAAIKSTTREALTSDLFVKYHIIVYDKSGKVLYNQELSQIKTFTTTSSIIMYNAAQLDAFEDSTNTILTRFLYEFKRNY